MMLIDPATRRILDLETILERVARQAVCSAGRELVENLSPSASPEEVQSRQRPVGEVISLLEGNASIPLGGLFDVQPTLDEAKMEGAAVAHDRWPRLCTFLEICEKMERFARESEQKFPALAKEAGGIVPARDLRETIERIFVRRGGVLMPELRDDASPTLAGIRRRLLSAEQGMMKTLSRLVNDYNTKGWLQEAFSTVRGGRHVLPFKASSKNRITGIHHGSSSTGETIFVEPAEVVELSNLIDDLRSDESVEEGVILRALTARLREWVPFGEDNMRRLARIDMWYAIGRHANANGWSFPMVGEKLALRIVSAHHPMLHLDRRAESVPVSLALAKDDRVLVFSGPNTGGKTTAMKTVGLTVLLLQCGIPAPLSPDSTLPIFDGVFADIGDSQDLGAGLSTFSGHVRRVGTILDEIVGTSSALVLLDELGTGTDPKEGSALAVAILEGLIRRGALTLATSHFEAVKLWGGETAGVRNASFALDEASRRPTYRVRLDFPGASEALEIAHNEGLPGRILERARELLGPQHLRFGELLRKIEAQERKLAESVRDAEARGKALIEQETIARQRADQLREDRKAARLTMIVERETMLREARERIEKMIAEMPSAEFVPQRKSYLTETRKELVQEQQSLSQERRNLRAPTGSGTADPSLPRGKSVYVGSLGDWAEIIEAQPGRDKVRVLMGRIEAEVSRADLYDRDPGTRGNASRKPVLLHEEPPPQPAGAKPKKSKKLKVAVNEPFVPDPPAYKKGATGSPRSGGPPPKVRMAGVVNTPSASGRIVLDLHGKYVEEAIPLLDKHIDNALLASLPYIKVCHGQGSGRLYRAVHDFLRDHPSVKNYRFAGQDEGGSGMTIVEF